MKNTDETGKDLNSLPMISGNSPSYQGFSDRARSPARSRRARLIQFADIVARQHQVDGGREAFELVHRGCAGNRRRHAGTRDQPRKRDRGRRAAVPFGV